MNAPQKFANYPSKLIHTFSLVALISMFTAGCQTVAQPTNFNTSVRLPVPETLVVSGVADIDGLNLDVKWNDAFRLDLIDGVSPSGVIMDGVADGSNLFLHFQIEENDLSSTDMIAIAIDTDDGADSKRLLLIKPCPSSGGVSCPSTADSLPVDIDYYRYNTTTMSWFEEPTEPHNVVAESATSGGDSWSIEVMIPRGAPFNLPATGYFGLYANVIETSSATFDIANQYTWPFNENAGDTLIFGTPSDIPSDSVWGNATLENIGAGVRISSSDISTNHGPSTISWDEPNEFYASVHNNSYVITGSPPRKELQTANQVRATFKWKNFGLPSFASFQTIPSDAAPAAGNPTGYRNLLPTVSETYQMDWTVPLADQAFYQANPHWCLRVELDSSDPSTIFYQSQAQKNMNFVETNSPFVSRATVDAAGYRLPEGKERHEYIIEERFYNFKPGLKWKSKLRGVEKVAKNTYRMKIDPERPTNIGLAVVPPAEAFVKAKELSIKMGDRNDARIAFDVRSEQLLTLFVEQRFDRRKIKAVRDQSTKIGSVRDNTKDKTKQDYRDQRPANALLYASWKGFDEASFFVGGSVSLKVPRGAEKLYLWVESNEQYDVLVESLDLSIYVTDIEDYHLDANPELKLDRNPNGLIATGSNLPTVIYRGKRGMGRHITIGKQRFEVYQSTGAFGYVVRGKKTRREN